MRANDTPRAESAPPPHPFAGELAERLAPEPAARVLFLGIGVGRNVAPFLAAGLRVDAVEDDAGRARDAEARFAAEPRVRVAHARYDRPYPFSEDFAGALSTSALLHGTQDDLRRSLVVLRAHLRPDAPLLATFGSVRDPRFGRGRQLDAATYAADDGTEAGIPHVYFDAARLRRLLAGCFVLDEAREESAASTAGRWAHAPGDTATIVHWFVEARRA